ncbi:MAG: pyrroloquinoline quinone precursor peptide PqqA [Sulfurifustaceae bacterium]
MPWGDSVTCRSHPCGVGTNRRFSMNWSKPTYNEIRWGFEITMYVATR